MPTFLGRRLLLVLGLAGLGVAGSLVVDWLTQRPHRVNAETFLKIEPGMTEEQVYGLVGVPPGDYRRQQAIVGTETARVAMRTGECKEWRSDHGVFWVWFDVDGKVESKRQPNMMFLLTRDSLFTRIRMWLGL